MPDVLKTKQAKLKDYQVTIFEPDLVVLPEACELGCSHETWRVLGTFYSSEQVRVARCEHFTRAGLSVKKWDILN